MYTRRVKVTKSNINEIRKSLNHDFASLTLALERECLKKYAFRATK